MSAIFPTADILLPTLIVIGPSVSASGQAIFGGVCLQAHQEIADSGAQGREGINLSPAMEVRKPRSGQSDADGSGTRAFNFGGRRLRVGFRTCKMDLLRRTSSPLISYRHRLLLGAYLSVM
jgi:hypothetical protein